MEWGNNWLVEIDPLEFPGAAPRSLAFRVHRTKIFHAFNWKFADVQKKARDTIIEPYRLSYSVSFGPISMKMSSRVAKRTRRRPRTSRRWALMPCN